MQDWRNLVSVRNALSVRKLSVAVVSSRSRAVACEGGVDAAWELGSLGGRRLGVLLWCEEEGHIYVVSEAPSLGLVVKEFRDAGAPWFRSVVCGKKGNSKRPHLVQINERRREQRGDRAASSAVAPAALPVVVTEQSDATGCPDA